MSQFEKLILRIKNLDKELQFKEVKKVLEFYGYEMHMPKGGGSHRTFRKPGKNPITVPQHEPIKRVYVLLVKEASESEEHDE